MPIRVYKPTTPGRRNASVNLHAEVTKKTPESKSPIPNVATPYTGYMLVAIGESYAICVGNSTRDVVDI